MIGVLMDDTDPLVTVMKVEKAPQETYADIGGLDNQIQEIKVRPGTRPGLALAAPCRLVQASRVFSAFALFWAALDLCCCARQGSLIVANTAASWWRGGLSLWWLLLARALERAGCSICDTWAWLPLSTWNLTGAGIELVPSALAGRFLTTGPPGKSCFFFIDQTSN